MKNLFTFLIFVFLFNRTNAQVVFCPPGAEWHYSFFVQAFSAEPFKWVNEQIKYTGDIVVNNDTLKVLEHKRYFKKYNNGAPNLGQPLTNIKQKGDTVFFRNATTLNAWQILYNYAALPGQGWQNTITLQPAWWTPNPLYPYTNTYTVTVDSIANVVINSFILRRLYVKYQAIIYQNSGNLVTNSETTVIDERLGCGQFLFNFYNRLRSNEYVETFKGFLCYKDSTFGTIQLTDKSCNYTDAVGVKENNYQNANVKIYPNPSQNELTITNQGQLWDDAIVIVKDVVGKKVKQMHLHEQSETKVDISELPNGVYVLKIISDNKLICTDKLIKMD